MNNFRLVFGTIAIVILMIIALSAYASLTYPRTDLSVPVSFTVGYDSVAQGFCVFYLDNKVEVQVSVQSGSLLWDAQILNQSLVIWEHSARQGEQTNYNSGWITLRSGSYNFTFRTSGVGSLNAHVSVSSKGGFW